MRDTNPNFTRALATWNRMARTIEAQAVMGHACTMDTAELREYIDSRPDTTRGTAYHAAKRIIDAIERESPDPDEFLRLAR